MFKKYYNEIRTEIIKYHFPVLAEKDRSEMIDIILTDNGKLSIESTLTDDIKINLFYGYLRGGYLEKSKNMYSQIHNKNIINRRNVLNRVIDGDDIECYKYAIQLLKITKAEIITALSKTHIMSNVLWFILNKIYPEKWEIIFDSFINNGGNFNALIRIFKEFNPRLILLDYFVNKIEKFGVEEYTYNGLFLRWLKEQIKEQNK
jgi:hypothetical protein